VKEEVQYRKFEGKEMRARGREIDTKRKEGKKEREEGWKMMFWNIAGVWNKDIGIIGKD